MTLALALLIGTAIAAAPPARRGSCLDSAKTVPMNMLSDNLSSSDVVQIDTLRWNARGQTEIIGFVYRLERGDWWFGARKPANTRGPGFAEIRRWLEGAVAGPAGLRELPLDSRDGGSVQYKLKDDWRRTLSSQHLSTAVCVAWPKNQPLPPKPK